MRKVIFDTTLPAVFVQVRFSSTRLPGKVMMKIENQTLIQRLNQRLKSILPFDIVFVTSIESSDDIVCNHFEENNITFFRGDLENVLFRFIEAANITGHTSFYRITGDNPFVDVHSILEHWKYFLSFDYVDNIHAEGNVIGTGFEFVKREILNNISNNQLTSYHREHVTAYIRENTESFKTLRWTPPVFLRNNSVFLTCDYPEDFILINKIYKKFNYDNLVPAKNIIEYVAESPRLKKINGHLHQSPNY